MPQNINAHTSTQAAFVTTWTEVATGSDDAEVICTRSEVQGKQHFITFLAVSTDARLHNRGGGVGAELKSGSDTKYEMWPRSALQESSDLIFIFDGLLVTAAAQAKTVSMDSDSGPWYVEFEAPIQMGAGEAATFSSDMDGIDDSVTFTMGGFTSETSF